MRAIAERPVAVRRLKIWGALLTLLGAFYIGAHPSPFVFILLVGALGALVLLRHPVVGLAAVIPSALLARYALGTGTDVVLNPTVLLVPALLGVWLLRMIRERTLHLFPSRTTKPLALFLAAGLLSLGIGVALWDPLVPYSFHFTIVQLAQWALFAFSAGIFWLTGNWVRDEATLRRLTFTFLAIGGMLAILRVIPEGARIVHRTTTIALTRAPFWMLLSALAGGQLLFNRNLSLGWRLFLIATLASVLVYSFQLQRETISNWAGVTAALCVLAWLRWTRWRWLLVGLALILLVIFFPAIYNFAGGSAEWEESGGSRLALISRVVQVTLRNPITGLGPAAYRRYARMEPLAYGGAYWLEPNVSSHNNYVDLFSHVGLLGLGLFLWFAVEVIRLALHLRSQATSGFIQGFTNGMLAAWAGALTLMMFADWILPFVYNIGFPGFQASVLVWLFLGGLVSIEQMVSRGQKI